MIDQTTHDARSPLLTMRGIVKSFGGTRALRGVDFDLRPGEIHALLGENGAGKSTLMNVLSGALRPDAGELRVDGRPVSFSGPRDAQAAGIAMIYQELDLVPGLDIVANLFLGRELTAPGGRLDTRRMRRTAAERLAAVGIDIDAGRRVGELSVAQRQLVAIAKALFYASRVLVMDEPTAALSAAEALHLFGVTRGLRERGVGVVYISHRLEEVPLVADRVTVMRDGQVVGTAPPDTPQAELVRLLVGRPLEELYPPRASTVGEVLLRLDNARFETGASQAGRQSAEDVSISVRSGEIVGLAGVMGAGRTELLSDLFGCGPRGRWRGTVEIDGRPARLGSIAAARRAGLAHVTDDRRGGGLMLRQSVGHNIVMSVLRRISPMGLMSRAAETASVLESIKRFDVRPARPEPAVGNLSGGNQQKVVFAKELLTGPKLLLLDEPTRGVDVGAKGEIYHRLRELTALGLGVLVASSELPELVGLCDRIVVMRRGRTVAEFSGAFDEGELLAAAVGGADESVSGKDAA